MGEPAEPGSEPPPEVVELARRRAAARAGRDFATADAVRAAIAEAGWLVRDTAEGYRLEPRPPYPVLADLADLPDRSAEPDAPGAAVSLLVEGWPDDVRDCVEALVEHAPQHIPIVGLDLGNVDRAGDELHRLASEHPERVRELHVGRPAGWAPARTALLRAQTAAIQVWIEPSTLLEGDALGPILAAFDDPSVVAAGWQGANVDLADDWRSFAPAGPGEVDVVLGYLLAVRRAAALEVGGPHPRAGFYRNADLEFGLSLRAAAAAAGRPGRIVVPAADLPVRQTRHRGYHDSDPARRDRESRRTYDRLLSRFRGRTDLLAPRG